MAGALNLEFLPETSQRTYDWLKAHNIKAAESDFYARQVFSEYGHMDNFIGSEANRDVFPFIWKELQRQGELQIIPLQHQKSNKESQAEQKLENIIS